MTEINPKNESDNGLLKPHMIKQKLDEYVMVKLKQKKYYPLRFIITIKDFTLLLLIVLKLKKVMFCS